MLTFIRSHTRMAKGIFYYVKIKWNPDAFFLRYTFSFSLSLSVSQSVTSSVNRLQPNLRITYSRCCIVERTTRRTSTRNEPSPNNDNKDENEQSRKVRTDAWCMYTEQDASAKIRILYLLSQIVVFTVFSLLPCNQDFSVRMKPSARNWIRNGSRRMKRRKKRWIRQSVGTPFVCVRMYGWNGRKFTWTENWEKWNCLSCPIGEIRSK